MLAILGDLTVQNVTITHEGAPDPTETGNGIISLDGDLQHEPEDIPNLLEKIDQVAGDGILTATLQPARLGFGGYLGPLRVALSLHAQTPASDEGETGEALFDLWYTPEPPAVLTGQVREAIVDGSLHLYLGIDVRIADPEVRLKPGFAPNFPFHPKMFIADRGKTVATLIGSANISNAAFTDSSEAAILENAVADVPELETGWSALWNNASDLTQALYTDYEKRWNKLPNPPREVPPQETAETREVVTFLSAIDDNALVPHKFDHLWIEAGSMSSGGSHSQLELPRGGNRFFGGDFDDYTRGGGAAVAICDVHLHARGVEWVRPLRWRSAPSPAR